jgi:dTDP-4-dehydrorhamnose reductase
MKYGCLLIHFSTDFVFKGDEDIVYTESTKTDPVNNYGKSKLLGESAIRDMNNVLIIRISWLYGPNGRNFASTIAKLIQERSELKIVADQYGKSTYSFDVVEATKYLICQNATGIFHFANDGVCNRYDFTREIYRILKSKKDIKCDILPIKATEFNDLTPRPTWSVLGTDKYVNATKVEIRDWRVALENYLMSYE